MSLNNYKTFLFFFILFFLPQKNKIFAQYSYKELKSNHKIKPYTQKTVDSILTSIKKDTLLYVEVMYTFSRVFYKNSNLNLASKYASKQINTLEKLQLKLDTKHYHNGIHQLGIIYLFKEEYDLAIETFKKSSNLNIYPKKRAQSLCRLGDCYRIIGDYRKSIDYFVKGVELLKPYGRIGTIIAQHTNLSVGCSSINTLEDIKLGIKHLNTADSIVKANYKNDSTLLFHYKYIYNTMGNLYARKHVYDFNKAKYFYKKSLKRTLLENNNLHTANTYSNIGELYLKKEKDSALFFLNKSIEFSNKLNNKPTNYSLTDGAIAVKSENLKILSHYYLEKQELDKALTSIQKSIYTSLKFKEGEKISSLQYRNVTRKKNTINALKAKITILSKLYEKKKSKTYLESIIETVNISDGLIQLILENNNTEQTSKFLWREDISQIYFFGSYAAHLLNKPELVFNYLEKNKAFLLSQSVNDNNQKLNLPNRVTKKDITFRKNILTLEEKIEKNDDSRELKDSLFDIKFNYQNFNDSIQKIYPNYFELRKKIAQVSLIKVQGQLNKNTVIISYGINNIKGNQKSILGLLITKNNSVSFIVNNPEKILGNLNQYRDLISQPLTSKEELIHFKEIAFSLYNNLFPTNEIKEIIESKQLLIIPDNELQNIPFEAFNTNSEKLTYLIESNDISYANSMSFLNINKNIERKQDKYFVGFAPIYFENNKLTSLEYSKKEILSIDALLDVTSYTENNATKTNFLEVSNNAKIIHLATHVNISKAPVIHFNNDSLKLHELYTYKNNADLVVLSACETNLGEIKEGEGVLSLARGFFYSGSKSVVSSLWKVNDVSTSGIMTDFYTNLKNRQTKIKALNNAKRKYLEEHSLSEKSPYYWASFILIGDTSQTFKYNYFNYFLVGFSILIISFLFFFKKRG